MSGVDAVDSAPPVDAARPSFVSPSTILKQSRQKPPAPPLSALEKEELEGLVRSRVARTAAAD